MNKGVSYSSLIPKIKAKLKSKLQHACLPLSSFPLVRRF
jgi:hypothetical protein